MTNQSKCYSERKQPCSSGECKMSQDNLRKTTKVYSHFSMGTQEKKQSEKEVARAWSLGKIGKKKPGTDRKQT